MQRQSEFRNHGIIHNKMIVRAFENSIENKVGQINYKKILANQINIVRYEHGTFRQTYQETGTGCVATFSGCSKNI